MSMIGEYMNSPPMHIGSDKFIREVAEFMLSKKVGSLLIKEGEEYIGIVTETDIVRQAVAVGLDSEATMISAIMSHPILSLDHALPMEDANDFMYRNNIRHMAVTKDEKIVGILSVRDLVSYLAWKSFSAEE